MVVTSGRSNRHVGSVADHVLEDLAEAGVRDARVEGMPHCDWVLIDAGDVIVHVFRPEVRAFYNLEKMWAPAQAERTPGELRTSDGSVTVRGRGRLEPLRVPCVSSRMRIVVAVVGRLKQGPERELCRALSQARGRCRSRRRAAAPRHRRDQGEPRRRRRPAHARGIDRHRQCHPGPRGHGDPGRARREHEQRFLRRPPAGLAGAGHARGRVRHRRRRRPRAGLREKADLAIAFGAATWPHQLVRIMLLEQLYRAVTILAGHPYHRS